MNGVRLPLLALAVTLLGAAASGCADPPPRDPTTVTMSKPTGSTVPPPATNVPTAPSK
jgi:hypothetical protein